MPRHFLVDDDLPAAEQAALIDRAAKFKAQRRTGQSGERQLAGRCVALVFEKPSTRTRLSFEVGVVELGGHPVVVDARTSQLGRGETVEDTARVLSRYVHAVVIRTFAQDRLDALAAASAVPVVNALTDAYHPCQILADLLTLREARGELRGATVAYFGDGNNVAASLLLGGALAGLHVRVAAPLGYQPDPEVVRRATVIAAAEGGSVIVSDDPKSVAEDADALYTDVWASMGEERDLTGRYAALRPYQIDRELLGLAAPEAVVLHCLPAHRGEEITAEVLDGPQSRVFDQAENRLHVQKALLERLLTP